MDLRLYPLDKQVCVLQIASCKYSCRVTKNTNEIHFALFKTDGWAKSDLIYQWKEKDPVQVVPNLHLPRFTLELYKSAYCDVKTNTGNFINDQRGRPQSRPEVIIIFTQVVRPSVRVEILKSR